MIVSVYKYFSDSTSVNKRNQKLTLRKRIAVVLGISESTVGRVIQDWNKCNDGSFTPHKILGRPEVRPDSNITVLIREIIVESNKTGRPLSTAVIRHSFFQKKDI